MPRVKAKEGVLWMGGLGDYMDDKFLLKAFKSLGEDDVEGIDIVTNKFTGEAAGYGFIYFDCDASALIAMHKLNGKIIPNSQPPVRFQLNHSSSEAADGNPFSEREFSIWVTDLPDDCTDDILYKTFSSRFDSIKTAKVTSDLSHGKKPYGFVRFTNQDEQRDALIHMNGFRGMGDRPIKVSMAIPKNKLKDEEVGKKGGGGQFSYFYEAYWANSAALTNYASYRGKQAIEYQNTMAVAGGGTSNQFLHTARINADNADNFHAPYNDDWLQDEEDENRIIEWDVPVNVDAMNREMMERSLAAWDSVDKDRWLYHFETEDSILPDFEKPVGEMAKKRTREEEYFAMLGEAMNEDLEVADGDGD